VRCFPFCCVPHSGKTFCASILAVTVSVTVPKVDFLSSSSSFSSTAPRASPFFNKNDFDNLRCIGRFRLLDDESSFLPNEMTVRELESLCKNEDHYRRPFYYGRLIQQKIFDTPDNTTIFSAVYEFNRDFQVWKYPSNEIFSQEDEFCFTVTLMALCRDSARTSEWIQNPNPLKYYFMRDMVTPVGSFHSPAFHFEMIEKDLEEVNNMLVDNPVSPLFLSPTPINKEIVPSDLNNSINNPLENFQNARVAKPRSSTVAEPSSSYYAHDSSEIFQESNHNLFYDPVEPEFFGCPSEMGVDPLEKNAEITVEKDSLTRKVGNPMSAIHTDDDDIDDNSLHSIDEEEEEEEEERTTSYVVNSSVIVAEVVGDVNFHHSDENTERDDDLSPAHKIIVTVQGPEDTFISSSSLLSDPDPVASISVIPSSAVFSSTSSEMNGKGPSKTRKRKISSPRQTGIETSASSSTHSRSRHSSIFGLPADIFEGIDFSLPALQRNGFNISSLNLNTRIIDGFPKSSVLETILSGKPPTLTHSKILFFPSPSPSTSSASLSSSSNNSNENSSQPGRDKWDRSISFHQHQQQISSIPPAQRHHYQQFPLMNIFSSFKRYCSDPSTYCPPVYRLFQPLVYYDYQVPGVKNIFLTFFKKIMKGTDPNFQQITLDFWNGQLSFPVAVEPALLYMASLTKQPQDHILSAFRLPSLIYGVNPLQQEEGIKETYDSFDENDDYDLEDETEMDTMRKLFKREERKVSSQLTKEFEVILSNDGYGISDVSSSSNVASGENISIDDFNFWLNYTTNRMSDYSGSEDEDSERFERINSFLSPQFEKCSKALNVLHSIVKSKDTYEFHQRNLFTFCSDTDHAAGLSGPKKRRGRPPLTQQQLDEKHGLVRPALSAEALSIALKGEDVKSPNSQRTSSSENKTNAFSNKRNIIALASSLGHVLASAQFRRCPQSNENNRMSSTRPEIENISIASESDSEMDSEVKEDFGGVSREDV
jgi:hypothetical protein